MGILASCLVLWVLLLGGCALKPKQIKIEGIPGPIPVDTILDTAAGNAITFDQLIDQLASARVIYVGERHTSTVHHAIQLRIIKALVQRGRKISVGMEMFDHTYQPRLDLWSRGKLDYDAFLKQTHWYANWKFKDALYKEILLYIKNHGIQLTGLNIPFHLPRKIAIGGLDSLTASERSLLPKNIDTTNSDHRAYLETVFKMHATAGRQDFENFYAAQCAWEDGMASAIADNLGDATMVVLAGNGHIYRNFGIPDRAFSRTGAPFRTVYLAIPAMEVNRKDGDFIWVTPQQPLDTGGLH
jgi:uncharacterized iron-regulated protein